MPAGNGRRDGFLPTPFEVIGGYEAYRAGRKETEWLRGILNREGERLGTSVTLEPDGTLTLTWGEGYSQ